MSVQLQRNAILGLLVSMLLAGTKLAAGIWGRSSALVADAVESLADSVASVLVWQALRVAAKPADDRHPYGYGKAEALAALTVGGLLIVAAFLVIIEAVRGLVIPHQAPAPWTLIVLVAVIVVKELLFRLMLRGAVEHNSSSAQADAWHHRSDAITSAAALVGVTIAVWGPDWLGLPQLVLADEIAALLASGIILITAWHLIRPAILELLDAADQQMTEEVKRVAEGVPSVVAVEKLFIRKSGPGYHVDMHLHVPPHLTISAAHALAGQVKAVLLAKIPSLTGVLIHIEPGEDEPSPTGLTKLP